MLTADKILFSFKRFLDLIPQRRFFKIFVISAAIGAIRAIAVSVAITVAVYITISSFFDIIIQYYAHILYFSSFIFFVHKRKHVFIAIIQSGYVQRGVHMFGQFKRVGNQS